MCIRDRYGLSGEIVTLPEVLKQNGYTTIGYHGGGNMRAQLGFDKGFDIYKRNTHNFSTDLEQIEEWFATANSSKIFFFYHTYQVHDPYFPPIEYTKKFGNYVGWFDNISREKWRTAQVKYGDIGSIFKEFRKFYFDAVRQNKTLLNYTIAQYDGEIAYTDEFVRKLFKLLQAHGLLNKTIVVVTSDHGEEFYEHQGFLHAKLYQEILYVPLIIYLPGFPHRKVDFYTTSLDLAPTVLDIVGITNPEFARQQEGESLMPYILNNLSRQLPIFSEYPYVRMSIINGPWKLYIDTKGNFTGLYNLDKDPKEQQDLAETNKSPVRTMTRLLNQKYAMILKKQFHVENKTPKELDQDVKNRLHQLGYI